MTRSITSIVIVTLLLGLLFVLDVYTTYRVFTLPHPGANDFYSRWKGAQVYWAEGIDPYSEQATLAIQQGIYGRPAGPDDDPGLFAYPFYTVFLLAPLTWLSYAWVEAIWLVILEFSLVGGILLYISLIRWRLPGWLLALTALWAVIFYHSARTILLGQFAGLVFLWMVATLWVLERKYDLAAGVLLALTTIKPQMSILFIPALLLWGLGRRRWRFLGAFGAAMSVLLGASFILLPSWLAQFVRQVMLYPSYTAIGSPVWVVTHHYLPQLGLGLSQSTITLAEVGLSVLLLAYLLIQWRRLPGVEVSSGAFHWLVGLTLIVTNLVVLRTATTNFVALYIPLFFALKAATDRLTGSFGLLALFYILSTIGLWVLFVTTVEVKFEHPIMYLPLPVGLFLVFVWAGTVLQESAGSTGEIAAGVS
jgi:hypothetical protein